MKSKVIQSKVCGFVQGELYISTDTSTIVICNESTNEKSFKSTCLVVGDEEVEYPWIVGECCDTSYGPKFIPFKGIIELIAE